MERISNLANAINITGVICSTQFKVGAFISGGIGTIISFLYGVPPHRYQAKKYKYLQNEKIDIFMENVQFFCFGITHSY
ncbi:hypothetical protein [Bacillus sp. JJ864]|uniref:hypothetical protein n=1 Tax=Bacillus sp. JJ864 TaxID=3122975 RepID=UPI003F68981C